MQGLILAAGMGTRLGTITEKIPKVLVEIEGRPLIHRTLGRLADLGVSETIIVVGYMKDKVMDACGHVYNGMKITYVENPIYSSTNNVYSLFLARNYIHDDLLMLEGDLLYRDGLIEKILDGKGDCNILVSLFNKETMDGTIIRAVEDKAVELVIGKRQGQNFDYSQAWKTVNVYKFNRQFMEECFMPALELYVKTESVNSYYELVLGGIIYYGNHDIRIIKIDESQWFEIDDPKDLKIAEEAWS